MPTRNEKRPRFRGFDNDDVNDIANLTVLRSTILTAVI